MFGHSDFTFYFEFYFYVTCALVKSLPSFVLVLFRAADSAIVSLAVLLTVYFIQLLSLFLCIFEQNKDRLIDNENLTLKSEDKSNKNFYRQRSRTANVRRDIEY